jgi:4-alpha-glucanotransferase
MEAAARSDAWLTVFPMQDVLRLDSGARFNTPGTVGGSNWQWRLADDELTARDSDALRTLATAAGRVAA